MGEMGKTRNKKHRKHTLRRELFFYRGAFVKSLVVDSSKQRRRAFKFRLKFIITTKKIRDKQND